MLRAFALECLFKAHVLLSGAKVCANGKILSRFKEHDLTVLAKHTGILPTRAERHVLKKLSAFAIGSGRYPIWPQFDKLKRIGGSDDFRADWGSPRDDLVFTSILKRLFKPFQDIPVDNRILEKA